MNTKHSLDRLMRAFVLILLANAAGRMASAQPAFLKHALDFPGVNQYVSVPAVAGVELNSAFTVESWVKVRSYANWSRLLDFGNGPANNNVVCALTEGETGHPIIDTYNGATQIGRIQTGSALPFNAWAHLAFVCDGTKGYIYINGSLVASNLAGTYSGPRTNNYLGRSNWPDAYANALFGEFRIWNVARTATEIQSATNTALAGNESNLRLYYRFGGTNNIVTNRASATGSAYDGTLVNGPLPVSYLTNAPVNIGPPLKVFHQGSNVIVSWPSIDPSYGVQTTADLSTTNWTTLTSVVIVSNRFYVTNLAAGTRYFRLASPCGVAGAPTTDPIPALGLFTARPVTVDGSVMLQPTDQVGNQLVGLEDHVLDARGFVDPARCVPGTLQYHWTLFVAPVGLSQYTAFGITGTRTPVLRIGADAIPGGRVKIKLVVTSEATGATATYDFWFTMSTSNLTPDYYFVCQMATEFCPEATEECPCTIEAALPAHLEDL